MKSKIMRFAFILLLVSGCLSCRKSLTDLLDLKKPPESGTPQFNLDVILRGNNNSFGTVKFRQDKDAARIVTLDTWVRDLKPNHSYLLQRAVDTEINGNCTGTAWLTLGKGLEPQAIETDGKGVGRSMLFRDLSTIPPGSLFDIHFQVIDATTMAVVLTSGCYTYAVR